jgi:transposase-like protein
MVERLKSCDNIVALAQELGLHRRLLYKWRDQLEPLSMGRNRYRARLNCASRSVS